LFNQYPKLHKRVYFAGGGKDLAARHVVVVAGGVDVGRRKQDDGSAAGDA
jgi:hypothetical protein